MKKMASGGGMPSIPGMPNIPGMPAGGHGGKKKGKGGKKNAKKQRYGNPAKAEAAAREQAQKAANRPKPNPLKGSSFGGAQNSQGMDPSQLNLPKGFEKFLK